MHLVASPDDARMRVVVPSTEWASCPDDGCCSTATALSGATLLRAVAPLSPCAWQRAREFSWCLGGACRFGRARAFGNLSIFTGRL